MKKQMNKIFVLLRLVLVTMFAHELMAADPSRDVGVAQQELGQAQKDITEKMSEPKSKKKPMKSVDEVLGEAAPEKKEPAKTTEDQPVKKKKKSEEPVAPVKSESTAKSMSTNDVVSGDRITSVVIEGDGALLNATGVRRDIESDAIGKSFTKEKATELAKKHETALHDQGYYFATIVPKWPAKDGALTLVVDQGRYGKTRILQRGVEGQKPYKGKYFSEKQVRERLKSLKEGDAFNYAELYNSVYRINAHPDMQTEVDLKLRDDKKGEYSKRVVDMDFSVEDNLPLHAALELSNNGTDVTDEWTAGLTLQYLNLSGNEDILTLNVPFSLDFESIRSVSLGYFRPFDWRRGGSVSLFGGYSELSSESIVDEIGLEGEGWFVGAQGGYNFIDNEDYTLIGSLGISHSVVTDNLVLQEQDELDREVALTPLLFLANYIANSPDRWGGLNMASLGLTVHSASFPGASDDEEFELQRENAKADYLIARLNSSRIQEVFSSESNPERAWTFHTKLDAQVATEPLIPSEQKGLGGYDTVRGYIEREFLGDDGVNGTLELRTPMHQSSVFPRWFKKYDERDPAFETIQGVLFVDAGYLSLKDSLAGEEDAYDIYSVGLGFRVALGSSIQMRADWGFPLEETEDSDTSGRGHLSLQLIF